MRRRVFLLVLFLFSLAWVFYYHSRQAPARALALRAGTAPPGEGAEAALAAARPDGAPSQAAILLLARDQPAAAAAAALESAGVSFAVTRDAAAAVRHPLVLIPFSEAPVELTPERLKLFGEFVSRGGTLVVQAPLGDPWAPLTGLARAAAGRERRRVVFPDAGGPALLRVIPLAAAASEAPWTRALETRPALGAEVLARFDTGEPAVLRRPSGRGAVYTLGVDLRDGVLRPHAGRSFDAGRASQGLEPGADAWGLLLLGWYQAASPVWARLRAAPGDAAVVLALSHGVETMADASAAVALSSAEVAMGARSTWFLRAGPSEDADEAQALDPRVIALARQLAAAGHEIGSHAVLHAVDFEALPESPEAAAPEAYRPGVTVDRHAQDADIRSEAAVSRARLERFSGRGSVLGFRAPGLAYPSGLASALEKGGYLYDSSVSGRDSLSVRPFFLPEGRAFERESGVVELPAAFEDERDEERPDGAAVDAALEQGVGLEATVVWALRPSAKGAVGALRRALAGKPRGTSVMRLVDAARFWRARGRARFSLEPAGQAWRLTVDLPEGAPALSFELSRAAASCSSSSSAVKASCAGKLVTITAEGPAAAEVTLFLQ